MTEREKRERWKARDGMEGWKERWREEEMARETDRERMRN